jgi:hypothetical protein
MNGDDGEPSEWMGMKLGQDKFGRGMSIHTIRRGLLLAA